jgi:putative endonuclease
LKLKPLEHPFKVSLGERGEMIAWGYLHRQGYKLVEKNFRCKLGEIDVIAEKKSRIVFIEVKTRSSHDFGRPEESVGILKQRKIGRLAEWYLKEKKWQKRPISFEVVAITLYENQDPDIRIIENAFTFEDSQI